MKDWLMEHHVAIKTTSPAGDMLWIELLVDAANQLLNANFSEFVHTRTNMSVIRTPTYSIPDDVAKHVVFIYPTTQ